MSCIASLGKGVRTAMAIHKEFSKELENVGAANARQTLAKRQSSLGQHCPKQYPRLEAHPTPSGSPLGPPLNIRQVASLIGCSPWSVRQTLIPRGLPHFRSG